MSSLRAFAHRLPPIVPAVGLRAMRAATVAPGFVRYLRDRKAYKEMPEAERLRWRDSLPKLADRMAVSPYDAHYLYQDTWAAQRVAETKPERHVDVGSRVDYACFLSAVTRVAFVDIRPLDATIEGVESIEGSVLQMPFGDGVLPSVSCLHVAEHIGLGRYGDPLQPDGTRAAIRELQRVVAPGGQLLFSLPVGRPRVCFNAHRIHDPREIPRLFDELELQELAGVDDTGAFRRHRTVDELADQAYACGMYRFTRPLDRG